jgi:acyl-CoA synthetase (AMP-forming)/AMP-acid ligase II
MAWKHGGTVVLVDEQTAKIPELLVPLIKRCGITVWFSTPTILTLLVQSGHLQSVQLETLRLVMFGGEPFPIASLRALKAQLPHPRYVHVLGSTETHIMAHFDVPSEIPTNKTGLVAVGKIAKHFRSRILDEDGNDAPVGVDGELCLSGPALTPGYWKAPEENARAFFRDVAGERWYRTGDIVRLDADGNLFYRSRRGRMVKKYGNRVELGEIEMCLYENSGIKEAAVVAVPDDGLGLKVKAYVVPRGAARLTILELKAHCAKTLPLYMVPDTFTFGAALPRTSTGKIDFPKLKEMV